jgi:hypothetical protein
VSILFLPKNEDRSHHILGKNGFSDTGRQIPWRLHGLLLSFLLPAVSVVVLRRPIVSFIETMLTITAGFISDSQGFRSPVELFFIFW